PLLVGVRVLHELDDCAVEIDERDGQEAVADVEGLGEDGVAFHSLVHVDDTISDVRLRPQRARDRAVRLEAEPFDVARVCPLARYPDPGRLYPALVWLPLLCDQADVVEGRSVELG